MPAYLIGHITVKDPDKWMIYVEGVNNSLVPYNAEVVFRGKLAAVLTGKHPHNQTVVIEFDDQATLQQWYNSSPYQELIPIRDEAADVVIVSYDA